MDAGLKSQRQRNAVDLSEFALQPLREDEEFILYRGRPRQTETSSILLLTPALKHSHLETLTKINDEYALKSELDPTWAIRPRDLSQYNDKTALVLEDPGGELLHRLIRGPMEVKQFLRLAICVTAAVGQLHKRWLIHKDLKPSNVFVDPANCHAWLTGFGIASRLPRERQSPEPPEFIAGTLAYMAPEQTGRMNRSIDSRSDLYSLGVTLYEMLTGSLPFTASDPMEWVHCHVARQPVPPSDRFNNVPGSVSAVIMKLLAKTAEERYQTAAGVESDLRRCLAEWETQGNIDEFDLGQRDASDRLMIPEKLYGREREIETLLDCFDRVVKSGTPELVLVSGYSGIGKSSVVNELHKPLVPPRGLFASGKFDQYKRDIPYATLAQAFQSLVRSLLSKSEAELGIWRHAFREALGPNGLLMVDLVPELKLIIGEQPPVPDLPSKDAQRRFQLVFRGFIGVFARAEHPLALFLDDLQWLDGATLDLLEDLLTQTDVRQLLLIGAYRDNEVDSAHPLTRKLAEIRRTGAAVHEIVLTPLSKESLGQLIADSLHCEQERAFPLAQLVHEKTGGNPFFSIQFITALNGDRLVVFDYREGRWSWDLNRIHAQKYTDNVVDLMVGKLNHLSIETQKALQLLACLGNSADISLLKLISNGSHDVQGDLREAVQDGLAVRMEDSYRFLHDRVREAAYSLIPEELRAEAHLRVGRLLVARTPPEKQEERIFEIVNQLNRGAALIVSSDERERLAELNLLAGKRAKASTAYASALNYFIAGSTMLNDDCWGSCHELTFQLELHRAECEFLSGQPSAAEERLVALSPRTRNAAELATVTRLRMHVCTTLDQNDRAVAVGLDYLRHLGMEWSPQPTAEEVQREYDRIWSQVGSRRIEDLIELPLMTKPDLLDVLDVLAEFLTAALFCGESLSSLVVCRMVNLSLEHGNSDGSCFAYVWFAIMAGPRFGNYEAGFRFGQLGYDLVEKRGLKRFQARTYQSFGNIVLPWTRHVREGRDLLRRAFDAANEIGDVTYAGICCDHLIRNLLAAGDQLIEVQREAESGLQFAQKFRFGRIADHIEPQLGLIRTLRGLTRKFGSFDDDQFDEARFERYLAGNPALAEPECWYWVRKLQARVFAGDYSSAVDASLSAQRRISTSPSRFQVLDPLETAEYHFHSALSHAASWDSACPEERQRHFEALTVHHRELELCAKNGPENFDNRAALVAGEVARIECRVLEAEQLYERAIRSAHANSFVQNEALANEVAARFYAKRGFEKIADAYLKDARYNYLRWGADGKVRQLDELYPHLREAEAIVGPTGTIATPVERLDLATVIKLAQAVSGEMILEKLIESLMRIAIEHAGAERGVLILLRGDELQIEAEASVDQGKIEVILRRAAVTPRELPESILQYVIRTRESVILDDASVSDLFSEDDYVREKRPKSVFCLPVIKQANPIGALYLENHLTPGAFTSDRIAVLKLLSVQAAISLENALLYSDLQRAEAYLTEAQRLSLTGSFGWNIPDGEIFWSDETYRITGYDRNTKPTLEAILQRTHPEDRVRFQEVVDKAVANQSALDFEHRLLLPDGCVKHVHVVGRPVRHPSGRIELVGAVEDVTAAKLAYQEIQRLKDQLYRENLALRDEVDRASMFEEIVGTSTALHAVLDRIAKVAPTDSSVLITGETGTGKELIARALHKRSKRSGRAFVSVNCAALAPSLISSELFGHEKGAFTGAIQRRLGRFELADGGTIFLDEVGELPPDTQIALLRVLQEREFERVGGAQTIKVDVRVIAATNRDLEAATSAGTFRRDLFYRLNVFPIDVPPLRERKDDILMLLEYFVNRFASQAGKNFRSFDKKTLQLLQRYEWPGNIRELQNLVERSVILSSGDVFSIDEAWLLTESSNPASRIQPSAHVEVNHIGEQEMIEAALTESRGRVAGPAGAAAKLGIPPTTLYSRIKALKIQKNKFKFG
jgi:predicted ATPase/transcriptional regulator with GAF, ATPase, and Fis domain